MANEREIVTDKENEIKTKLKNSGAKKFRLVLLIFIFVTTSLIGLLHQFKTNFITPPIDAFCPFGGLETFVYFVQSGKFLQRLQFNNIVLIFSIVITAIFFAKTFCGNICPLGFMQEVMSYLRSKLKIERKMINKKVDKYLRLLKYIVLIVVLYFTYKTATLVIRSFDPWASYHHIVSEDLIKSFAFGFSLLILSLVLSFFYDRFFCKYLCPQGAFLSIFSKLSFTKIERNINTCIDCKICTKVCPVNIEVHTKKLIKDTECINCNKCVVACPKADTLQNKIFGKTIGVKTFITLTVLLLSIPIAVATFTASFNWEMDTISKESKSNDGVIKMEYNTDAIRGMNTFKEVSLATGISKDVFISHFGISNEDFEKPIRDSKVETSIVRDFVKEYIYNK